MPVSLPSSHANFSAGKWNSSQGMGTFSAQQIGVSTEKQYKVR